jgi:Tfp pilus assembly protein PilN
MPNINLIAVRRQAQKKIEQLSRSLFIGLITSLGIVGVLGTYLAAQSFSLTNEKRELEISLSKLKPVLDEIKSYEEQRDQMTPKVETLEVAQVETLRWCAYLQAIADAIPRGAWLNSMSATVTPNPEEPAHIKLSGVAANDALVSETLMNLKNKAPLLQDTTMPGRRDLPPANGGTIVGKAFEIETNLAPVVQPTPEPTKKNKENKTSGSS